MSQLDKYISTLLSDDSALESYLKDPKAQALSHGLSKADASILRRCVNDLPATAKSGHAIIRPLGSYRSSVRLLQNVLHNFHGHKIGASMAESSDANINANTIQIYYNTTSGWTGAPVDSPAEAYQTSVYAYYAKTFNINNDTVGDAMGFSPDGSKGPFSGQLQIIGGGTVDYRGSYYPMGGNGDLMPYITGFTINKPNTDPVAIDISFDNVKSTDRLPFWFYSVNGNALVFDPGAEPECGENYSKNPDANVNIGEGSESFAGHKLPTNTFYNNIVWQAIAPDQCYGFAPCY